LDLRDFMKFDLDYKQKIQIFFKYHIDWCGKITNLMGEYLALMGVFSLVM